MLRQTMARCALHPATPPKASQNWRAVRAH